MSAVERAALDESVTTPGLDPVERVRVFNAWAMEHPTRDEYGAFMAGYRAALAVAAPTVEQVAEVLAAHPDFYYREAQPGDKWYVCEGCGVEIETHLSAVRYEFVQHQAEQVVALWGAP